jgi:hypothetical protein
MLRLSLITAACVLVPMLLPASGGAAQSRQMVNRCGTVVGAHWRMRIRETLGDRTAAGTRYRVRALSVGCGFARRQVAGLTRLTASELRRRSFGRLNCQPQPLGSWFPKRVHVLSGKPRTAFGWCGEGDGHYFEWSANFRIFS